MLIHFHCDVMFHDVIELLSGEFLQSVKRHLHSLLAVYDGNNTFSSIKSNWVIKEASNIDALQEGGTFR